MAGSYLHVIELDGSLSSNEMVNRMLENGGDVYEAVEQMYGMIWYLAAMRIDNSLSPEEAIAHAQKYYKQGIQVSPTRGD